MNAVEQTFLSDIVICVDMINMLHTSYKAKDSSRPKVR
jgi:hypothetical protein